MSAKNSDIKRREDFMLSGELSELDWVPKTEEQISKDLFKFSDPDKMIDAFEKQLGIKVANTEIKNQIYKCVALSPSTEDEDRLLLQKFYNSPEQYQVINRSDNWTNRGELKIFLEYFENLDVRNDKDQSTNF
jgi:hypothetical protein